MLFMLLYKEQYYRYLYGKMQRGPGLNARIQSYINYNDIFSMLLDVEPLKIDLPDVWLWDIVDEFIYQVHTCTG